MSASEDRKAGEALLGSVSRETLSNLQVYAELLERWNRRINLVSPKTIGALWIRHIADCAQLGAAAPTARSWIDLGAGAGLPGLVVAALRLESTPLDRLVLVESDARKCAFMAEAARAMGLSAQVEARRIEAACEDPELKNFDVVSARALAPLEKLLPYAKPFLAPGGICLFPKGRTASLELTEAARHWHMVAERIPSLTDPDAVILKIREIARVGVA